MSKKKSKKALSNNPVALGLNSWQSFWRGVSKALRSKKFLAFLGASTTAVIMNDWPMVVNLAMVYMGAQGAVDVAGKFKR